MSGILRNISKIASADTMKLFLEQKSSNKPLWELNPLEIVETKNLKEDATKKITKAIETICSIELDTSTPYCNDESDGFGDGALTRYQIKNMKLCSYLFAALEMCETIKNYVLLERVVVKIYAFFSPVITDSNLNTLLLPQLKKLIDSLVRIPEQQYQGNCILQKIVVNLFFYTYSLCAKIDTKSIEDVVKNFNLLYSRIKTMHQQDQGQKEDQGTQNIQNKPMVIQEFNRLADEFFFCAPCFHIMKQHEHSGIYEDIYFKLCPLFHTDVSKCLDILTKQYKEDPMYVGFVTRIIEYHLSRGVFVKATETLSLLDIRSITDVGMKIRVASFNCLLSLNSLLDKNLMIPKKDLSENAQNLKFKDTELLETLGPLLSYPCFLEQLIEKRMRSTVRPSGDPSQNRVTLSDNVKSVETRPKSSKSAKNSKTEKKEKKGEEDDPTPEVENLYKNLAVICSITCNSQKFRELYNSLLTVYNTTTFLIQNIGLDILDIEAIRNCFFIVGKSIPVMMSQCSTGQSVDEVLFNPEDRIDDSFLRNIMIIYEKTNLTRCRYLRDSLPWIFAMSDIDISVLARIFEFCLRVHFMAGKYEEIMRLGQKFQEVTKGNFSRNILPLLIQANELVTSKNDKLSKDLSDVIRDTPRHIVALNSTREKFGRFLVERSEGNKSNVETVIKSYDNVISTLSQKHELCLLMQGLNELGDIYCYSRNYGKAFKCWERALDCVFDVSNTLEKMNVVIRDSLKGKSLLSKVGIKRCLIGTTISLKLSKYRYLHNNFHGATICAVFASEIAMAIFGTSSSHPQRFCDFSDYTLDSVAGIHLLDDYLFNVQQLIELLQHGCHHLYHNGQYLRSLQLCTLYEYISRKLSRDLKHMLDARILKVNILSEIGYFAEASKIINDLFCGRNLPHIPLNEFNVNRSDICSLVDPIEFVTFSNDKTLDNAENLQFLMWFCENQELQDSLITLYGSSYSKRIMMARAYFLLKVASHDPIRCAETASSDLTIRPTSTKKPKGKKPASTKKGEKKTLLPDITSIISTIMDCGEKILKTIIEEGKSGIVDAADTATILQCKYYLIQSTFMRGSPVKSLEMIKDLSSQFEYIAKMFTEYFVPKELWIRLHYSAASILLKVNRIEECKEMCNRGEKIAYALNEVLLCRYFKLFKYLYLLREGNLSSAENELKEILSKYQDIGFEELDDSFLAKCYAEYGLLVERQIMKDLADSWRIFVEPQKRIHKEKSKCEEYYLHARDILNKQLYHNGIFLRPENKIQKINTFVRRDEKILLMRMELKIGMLLCMRGELLEALSTLQNIIDLSEQCSCCPPPLMSECHYYMGRINRQLINTPASIESVWGSKRLKSKVYTEQQVKDLLGKADLSFLSPSKCLHKCLHSSFVNSFHDHLLIKNALLELVYLYGSKSVDDEEALVIQVAIASSFLILASRVSKMLEKIPQDTEKMCSDFELVKNRPPMFACEEIAMQRRVKDALQNGFLSSQQELSQSRLQKKENAGKKASNTDYLLRARNIMQYYLFLIREFETAPFFHLDYLEVKLIQMHRFLMREFPPYASECILANVPSIKDLNTNIEKGLICVQFYAVDNGLFQLVNNNQGTTDPLELLKQARARKEVDLPFLTMFYAIQCDDIAKKEKQLPVIGMLRFEQKSITKIFVKLKELANEMAENSIFVLSEEPMAMKAPITADKKKKTPNSARKNEKPEKQHQVPSNPRMQELIAMKDEIIKMIIDTLRNPSSRVDKFIVSGEEIPKEMTEIVLDKTQVDIMCDVFNPFVGTHSINEALSKWFRDVLCIYHDGY